MSDDLRELAEREMIGCLRVALEPGKAIEIVRGMRAAAAEWATIALALRARAQEGR